MPTLLHVYIAVLLCLLDVHASNAKMNWFKLKDQEAVCNDFSRAGYFLEYSNDSDKWIVFLESGGLCYSPKSCNRRLFHPTIRKAYTDDKGSSFLPHDQFNIAMAWNDLKNEARSEWLNPYMTSLSTYNVWEIEGRDLLDASEYNNPIFHNYNKVLIPYCSSDLWVGNDTRELGIDVSINNPQDQFFNQYDPKSNQLQFTFRGQTIFKSVIKELITEYNLDKSHELVMAGSSAGGVGAINHAKWLVNTLNEITRISIITDSAWFINFHDIINARFIENTMTLSKNTSYMTDLLSLIQANPQCADTTYGSPCCISQACMLQVPEYFPVGRVPVLSLISLYDILVLADALVNTVPIGGIEEDDPTSQPSVGIDFLFAIAEYSGSMNTSIKSIYNSPSNFSYISTQCFQHVYFATSSLFDTNGILGKVSTEALDVNLGNFDAVFR